MSLVETQPISTFREYKGKSGYFGKAFIIDADLNGNGWRIAKSCLRKRMYEWVGKPMLEFFKVGIRSHPEYETYDIAIKEQEDYQQGRILNVGYDKKTENYWCVFKTNEKTYHKIQNNEIQFVSPSLFPIEWSDTFPPTAIDAKPTHLAFVDVPAYGNQARIVGVCNGTTRKCKNELKQLVADIDNNISHVRDIRLISAKLSLIKSRLKLSQMALQASVSDGDRKNPDNWFTMNGRKIFIEKGKTKEESAKNFLDKTDSKDKPTKEKTEKSTKTGKQPNKAIQSKIEHYKSRYFIDDQIRDLEYTSDKFAERMKNLDWSGDIERILQDNLKGVDGFGEFNPEKSTYDKIGGYEEWRDMLEDGILERYASENEMKIAKAIFGVEEYIRDTYSEVRDNVKYVTRTMESSEAKSWADGDFPDFKPDQPYLSMSLGDKPQYMVHDSYVIFEVTDSMRKSMTTPWRRLYIPLNTDFESRDSHVSVNDDLLEVKVDSDYFDFKVHKVEHPGQVSARLSLLKIKTDNKTKPTKKDMINAKLSMLNSRMRLISLQAGLQVSDGDRKNPDNWFTMNGRKIFIEKGKSKEEAAKSFLGKNDDEFGKQYTSDGDRTNPDNWLQIDKDTKTFIEKGQTKSDAYKEYNKNPNEKGVKIKTDNKTKPTKKDKISLFQKMVSEPKILNDSLAKFRKGASTDIPKTNKAIEEVTGIKFNDKERDWKSFQDKLAKYLGIEYDDEMEWFNTQEKFLSFIREQKTERDSDNLTYKQKHELEKIEELYDAWSDEGDWNRIRDYAITKNPEKFTHIPGVKELVPYQQALNQKRKEELEAATHFYRGTNLDELTHDQSQYKHNDSSWSISGGVSNSFGGDIILKMPKKGNLDNMLDVNYSVFTNGDSHGKYPAQGLNFLHEKEYRLKERDLESIEDLEITIKLSGYMTREEAKEAKDNISWLGKVTIEGSDFSEDDDEEEDDW